MKVNFDFGSHLERKKGRVPSQPYAPKIFVVSGLKGNGKQVRVLQRIVPVLHRDGAGVFVRVSSPEQEDGLRKAVHEQRLGLTERNGSTTPSVTREESKVVPFDRVFAVDPPYVRRSYNHDTTFAPNLPEEWSRPKKKKASEPMPLLIGVPVQKSGPENYPADGMSLNLGW
ncbi:MAG: hypothetical protein Q8O97_01990 [bacterium]|nr:hypothetical protein [bacterium]